MAQNVAPESRFKFDLYDDYAVVLHGNIGGFPADVLVDTGSIETILDSAVAKRLRLTTSGEVKLALLNEIRTAKRAVVDYELGALRVTQSVVVTDLSRFSAELGGTISLILGHNGLCRHDSLEIDYESKELIFGPGDGDCRNALPIVSSDVPGRTDPVHILVDTGNKGLLLFGSSSNYGFVPGKVKTGTDPRKVRTLFGTVSALKFGDRLLTNQDAYLVEQPVNVPSLINGFLGGGGLGLRALRIDFKAHTVDLRFN
jgi:predicted aspartyl protease